jgi:hypothetical protein
MTVVLVFAEIGKLPVVKPVIHPDLHTLTESQPLVTLPVLQETFCSKRNEQLGVDFAFENADCGAADFWREFIFLGDDLDVDFAGAAHLHALRNEQLF